MTASVVVRHNFECGHRLPILAGKCQSLHGHSWWAAVTVEAPGQPTTVVEFGAFKATLREWIDTHLDHGLMLGEEDPLCPLLSGYGKVFPFTAEHGSWPTVENVALLLAMVATDCLEALPRAPRSFVSRVEVNETHVNGAVWTP